MEKSAHLARPCSPAFILPCLTIQRRTILQNRTRRERGGSRLAQGVDLAAGVQAARSRLLRLTRPSPSETTACFGSACRGAGFEREERASDGD